MRPETVSTAAAAYFLGDLFRRYTKRTLHPDYLPETTISAACKRGEIAHVRSGRLYRIPVTTLEEMLGRPVTEDALDKAAAAVRRHRDTQAYRDKHGVVPPVAAPASAQGALGRSAPEALTEHELEIIQEAATVGALEQLQGRARSVVHAMWPSSTAEEKVMLEILVLAAAIKEDNEFDDSIESLAASIGENLVL